MFLLLLLAGTAVVAQQRRQLAEKAPAWMFYLEPSLVGALGLLLTITGTYITYEHEAHDHHLVFDSLARSRAQNIKQGLQRLARSELGGLARFCAVTT